MRLQKKFNISYGSCTYIFTNILGFKRVLAKFFPKLLNFEQKQNRKNIVKRLLAEIVDDSEMVKHIIAGE